MDDVLFSSRSDEWATPQSLFDELDAEFCFTLDPCSTHENAKCKKHFVKADDGLTKSWQGHVVFMNPPYGRTVSSWMEKAFSESKAGCTVVALVPARTCTAWWHDFAMKADEIRFLRGRLKFGDARHCAPFPSAIVVFRKEGKKTTPHRRCQPRRHWYFVCLACNAKWFAPQKKTKSCPRCGHVTNKAGELRTPPWQGWSANKEVPRNEQKNGDEK